MRLYIIAFAGLILSLGGASALGQSTTGSTPIGPGGSAGSTGGTGTAGGGGVSSSGGGTSTSSGGTLITFSAATAPEADPAMLVMLGTSATGAVIFLKRKGKRSK